MKIRKVIFNFVAAIGLVLGLVTTESRVVKAENVYPQTLIQKTQQEKIKSYRIRENVYLKWGKEGAHVKSLYFAREKPLVAKWFIATGKDKDVEWITEHYTYYKEGKHWYKQKNTKFDLKELKSNPSILNKTDFNKLKDIVDSNTTVTQSNGQYILSVADNSVTNTKFTNLIQQSLASLKYLTKEDKKTLKEFKILQFSERELIDQKNYHVKSVQIKFKIKLAKNVTMTFDKKEDQFNQHNRLRVPKQIVRQAKKAK